MPSEFYKRESSETPEDLVSQSSTERSTSRAQQREREEEHFVPVIVKRTDEARRHPDDVLEMAIVGGLEQLKRGPYSLFLSWCNPPSPIKKVTM